MAVEIHETCILAYMCRYSSTLKAALEFSRVGGTRANGFARLIFCLVVALDNLGFVSFENELNQMRTYLCIVYLRFFEV